jgi:excisionase family DNA binding protein
MAPMKCPARNEPADVFQDSFTLTHLARRWHVHRREVRQLLQTGQLPFVQVSGQLRVPRAAVAEFEQAQQR